MQSLIRNMGNHVRITESEVKVNASGKSITYDGTKWIRKDVYDRANQAVLNEQAVIRELKTMLEGLRILLDEHSIDWKVTADE